MTEEAFTIIGGAGFIGSHLVADLKSRGNPVSAPVKNDMAALKGALGHVIFCAGTTSDSRERPFDAVDAHVCLLRHVLQACEFTSLTYLSSTRVYLRSASTAEDAPLVVLPGVKEDIFALSKLTGESLCLNSGRANVRAVRISNVVGRNYASGDFIFSLMRDAARTRRIVLETALESEKDYILIDDVVAMLVRIAAGGTMPLYNLASGQNLTHAEVVSQIREALPSELIVQKDASLVRFRPIDTAVLRGEFGLTPMPVLPVIFDLAKKYPSAASA